MRYSTSSLFNMTVAVSAFVMMMAFFGSVPPVHGFTLTAQSASQSMAAAAETRQCLTLGMAADDSSGADPNEIVGKRIIVTGDVNGGYLRTCISNEAGKFRRLLGTMSPPDDGEEAEIYVEVSCTPARKLWLAILDVTYQYIRYFVSESCFSFLSLVTCRII